MPGRTLRAGAVVSSLRTLRGHPAALPSPADRFRTAAGRGSQPAAASPARYPRRTGHSRFGPFA